MVGQQFQDYVEQRFADVHLGHACKSFRILTDGMWDVHIQLSIEARRKGLTLRTPPPPPFTCLPPFMELTTMRRDVAALGAAVASVVVQGVL